MPTLSKEESLVPMNTDHTSKQFDVELEALRARVLKMGGLVEEQIQLALEALMTGDVDLCERVEQSDHKVNALEVGIDEDVSSIIARRQPAAGDLRMLRCWAARRALRSCTGCKRFSPD